MSDAFSGAGPTARALKSDGVKRPRARSEAVKMVRVASPPAEMVSQSPGDSWIANTNDSNFTLTLPFRPAASVAAPPETSTASATGSVSSSAATSSRPPKSPLEFLLVDDNPINLKVRLPTTGQASVQDTNQRAQILSAYMRKLQKRHATASNGLEALQVYTSQPYRFCCILIGMYAPMAVEIDRCQRVHVLTKHRYYDARHGRARSYKAD